MANNHDRGLGPCLEPRAELCDPVGKSLLILLQHLSHIVCCKGRIRLPIIFPPALSHVTLVEIVIRELLGLLKL